MKLVRLGTCLCAVSCLLIWLAASHGQAGRAPRSGAEDASSPEVESGIESLAALKTELKQVSRRLRDLEYPELRKRDPREVQILETLASARERLFVSLKMGVELGTKSAHEMLMARYHLAVARAELAWAKQNVHEAVSRLVEAADSAAEMILVIQTSYDAGKVTLGAVLEAQAELANAELALIRAEKVAAVAKVDISDIKRDGRKRFQEEPSPDRGPGLVPPPAAETERR